MFLLTNTAWSQTTDTSTDTSPKMKLKLCTAQAGNNYHKAGELIAGALRNLMQVEVVETKGSWENLETMSASRPRCDAILAQDDAVALHRFQNEESKLAMERLATLFNEKAHVLCNRKVKATRFTDLRPGAVKILTNEYGSGSFITWRVMSKLNPTYRQYGATEKGLDEALLTLLDNEKPTCLFYVSRLGGQTLNRANQNFGDRLEPKRSRPGCAASLPHAVSVLRSGRAIVLSAVSAECRRLFGRAVQHCQLQFVDDDDCPSVWLAAR